MKAKRVINQFRKAMRRHGRGKLLEAMILPLAREHLIEDLYYTDDDGYFEYCYTCGKPYADHYRKKLPRKQRDDYRFNGPDTPSRDSLCRCDICGVDLTCHLDTITETLDCFTWLPGRANVDCPEMAYIFWEIMECVRWNDEDLPLYEPVADKVALHTFAHLSDERRCELAGEAK